MSTKPTFGTDLASGDDALTAYVRATRRVGEAATIQRELACCARVSIGFQAEGVTRSAVPSIRVIYAREVFLRARVAGERSSGVARHFLARS